MNKPPSKGILINKELDLKGIPMEACPARCPDEVFGIFFFVFTCFGLFIGLVLTVLTVVAFCKIFQKAGYSWALGLLMLVPVANFIMPLYLAFADWPILKQMHQNPQA